MLTVIKILEFLVHVFFLSMTGPDFYRVCPRDTSVMGPLCAVCAGMSVLGTPNLDHDASDFQSSPRLNVAMS